VLEGVERLGGERWWAARNEAVPVRVEYRWTDPFSLSPSYSDPAVQSPTTVHASFDRRQFSVDGKAFTDLEVRTAFSFAGSFPSPDVSRMWQGMGDGIDRRFNAPGHRLPDGSQLHVTPKRVPYPAGADAHWMPKVVTPGPDSRLSHNRLPIRYTARSADGRVVDLLPDLAAHEFGHQLGLPDESRRRGDAADKPVLHVEGSLMGGA
jgi:hypothetical protein